MTNVNQFLIKPSFKIRVAYGGFGIFLLILSIPIAFISIITFGPTILVVALFFLLICGFLVLEGIFFIAGSFRSFIGIHNDKIRFRNYFRTHVHIFDKIDEFLFQIPMDGGERFPLNKVKIHLKDGKKSRIFMRYYNNEEKSEIEKAIKEIINQESHIKKEEQFIQKQEADDYDDLYD